MSTISIAALDSTDIGLIRSWRNDHRIWRWTRQNDLISDAEQVRWFNRQSDDPTIKMYKIVAENERNKKAPVGVCGLTSINPVNRSAEISLYIAPEAQGRGIAPHAFRCIVLHGFLNLGLNSIYADVFAGNPVTKVLDKVGFRHEGTRRQAYWKDGQFTDAHFYSILAEDWNEACRRFDAGATNSNTRADDLAVAPAEPAGRQATAEITDTVRLASH